MTNREHIGKTLSLGLPVMASQLGHVLVGLADNVMVGQVSVPSLAASSLSNSIFYFFFMFGIGVSYAITPMISKADMRKDISNISQTLKHGLVINMITGLVLFLFIMVCVYTLPYFNQPKDVVALAIPYLILISLSILPFMVYQTFRQFCEGLSMTYIPMVISIVSNLLNVALNYIFIFGKLGFDPMGLFGAGVATLISRIVMGILMFAYFKYHEKFHIYREIYRQIKFDHTQFSKILNIGVPAGLQFIFEVGAFAIAAIMTGWLGTISLAAHQIAINLSSISYMMATGLGAAATIRVGNQIGNQDLAMVSKVGKISFFMVIVLMSIWALVFVVFRFWLPWIYVDDPMVISTAAGLLIIAALFQLSDGIQVVGLGALRGMEDVKIPTWITLVAYWVIALPVGYLLGFQFGLGVKGIWYGLSIGLTVSAIFMVIRFKFMTQQRLNLSGGL